MEQASNRSVCVIHHFFFYLKSRDIYDSFLDTANCNPVWYTVGGYARDVNIFIEFYGEDGSTEGTTATDTCLAFECPSCRDQSKREFCFNTSLSVSCLCVTQ